MNYFRWLNISKESIKKIDYILDFLYSKNIFMVYKVDELDNLDNFITKQKLVIMRRSWLNLTSWSKSLNMIKYKKINRRENLIISLIVFSLFMNKDLYFTFYLYIYNSTYCII